jgi:hypothetical protein
MLRERGSTLMYRLVDCGAWDDPWFSDQSPDGKLLFLYLLTNRRTNSVGAYEITVRQITFETGMPSAVIERLLVEMSPKVQWWPEHSIVWVRNFYGKQNNGEKIEINARRIVAELPSEIREAVGMAYPALSYKEDTPSIPHASPMDKQNSNVTELNKTETEHDTPRVPAREGEAPYHMLETFCAATERDIGKLTTREKNASLAVAKRLLADDVSCAEVRGFVAYLAAQDWRTNPVTLFTVEKEIGTWRASGAPPAPKARASPTQKPTSTDLLRDAGRRVQERHDERRRDQPGDRNDQYPLLADSQHGRAQRGPDDRDLGDDPLGYPIDAVYRERP